MIGLIASIPVVKNQFFFWLYFWTKKTVSWYFRYLISAQLVFHIYIFYTIVQIPRSLSSSFINKNMTNELLSISCGLKSVDQQVECSLIQTFWLLKKIPQSLGCLFQKKNSWYLELSTQLKLFLWELIVDLFWCIDSLSNK